MRQPIPASPQRAQEAVQVASAILNGSISIVDGARRMAAVRLYSGHVEQLVDEDYALFVYIASKTGHLPLGEVRNRWSSEALGRADAEMKSAETSFHKRALIAAQALVDRYEKSA